MLIRAGGAAALIGAPRALLGASLPQIGSIAGSRRRTAAASEPFFTNSPVVYSRTGNYWLGCKITIGSASKTVTDIGRWVISGNSATHTLKILLASNNSLVASTSVNCSGATAGAYLYGSCTPATLAANTAYYLVSDETGGDSWYDDCVIANSGIATVNKSVYSINGGSSWVEDKNGEVYVPPNFKYY
jgi:hypothetical protein